MNMPLGWGGAGLGLSSLPRLPPSRGSQGCAAPGWATLTLRSQCRPWSEHSHTPLPSVGIWSWSCSLWRHTTPITTHPHPAVQQRLPLPGALKWSAWPTAPPMVGYAQEMGPRGPACRWIFWWACYPLFSRSLVITFLLDICIRQWPLGDKREAAASSTNCWAADSSAIRSTFVPSLDPGPLTPGNACWSMEFVFLKAISLLSETAKFYFRHWLLLMMRTITGINCLLSEGYKVLYKRKLLLLWLYIYRQGSL